MSAVPSSSPKNIKISFITFLSKDILGSFIKELRALVALNRLGEATGAQALRLVQVWGPRAAARTGPLSFDCNSTQHARNSFDL